MVAERPIIFSGPMVRSILDGRKAQTRRIVKPQPPSIENVRRVAGIGFSLMRPERGIDWCVSGPVWAVRSLIGREPTWRCPYGVPGDRLWVKETWMRLYEDGDGGLTCLVPSSEATRRALRRAKYRATDEHECPENFAARWRSPIHMPRWASRITLEITDVRVQRVQDISEDDARAEGVDAIPVADIPRQATLHYRDDFAQLWEIINGKRAPWRSNPWVYALTFRRVEVASG